MCDVEIMKVFWLLLYRKYTIFITPISCNRLFDRLYEMGRNETLVCM